MATTSAQVQQLYVAYLGRAADKAGLDYWLGELNATPATITLEQVRANFVNEQPEYANAYAGLSRQDTVVKIYNNLFGRAPDDAGLAYWTTGGGASVNADQLLTAFINGAAAADAQVITNKVLVSEVYTSAAGTAYTSDDAKAVLSGVNGTPASVSAALTKLENGSLPGVAVPAGVAALKAEALAQKSLDDFKAAQVTTLNDLNKAVVELNDKLAAPATLDALVTPPAGTAQSYDDVDQAITNAGLVRTAVSSSTTVTLQANATNQATAYATARDTFTKAALGNVDLVNTYEKAVTTNAGLKGADTAAVTLAEGKVQADFTAANTGTALATANAAAGGTTVTDAASLYAALTDGTKTAAQIKAVSDAFTTFLGSAGATDFNTLKSLAATDYTKNAAVQAEADAKADIAAATGGTAFQTAFDNKATADTTLANAQAADALVKQATAISDGVKALTDAEAAITVPSYVKDLAANATGAAGADLFHFADGVKATDDWTIASFAKGDALYFGEGYTFNNGALTTGDSNKLEYFFVQKGADVQVVIETKAFGSANLDTNATTGEVTVKTGAEDAVAIITLTGVTAAQLQNQAGYIVHA
ncbi:DUF4214 domain-containing protein (plasmid) [Pseudomonas sp. DTU_2021_1001937_2_SI_NGA_ILE_001]|uniref:DUF4214 domain-containing protein n=1 Tax=Pseudomonas sp. DTU_2021_1001937_2_SI_NGA_ILE_001 TaxID=3077589 RepID=UPI0028FC10A9|nr:DUF4214 domain-containing protein [Pseudomonas sp. DTU_2021_1001937_2_SI_NGA_ILE_001]WNW14422.1 DUF4214 domain-containing protein [Pseudomonas sp. DTU_2021_1001937_2_SI_NGA_ILE_001]